MKKGSSRQGVLENLKNGNSVTETTLHENVSNHHLLRLKKGGFTTPDKKVKELLKELTNLQRLDALRLLFEDPANEFSSQTLRDSLVTLADPEPFDYYSKESMVRLEVHLRTW